MAKILYVEDEPFLAKIVKESLESRTYEVKHLADGENFLAQYKLFEPDICILDVMLPHKSGFELAVELRANDKQVPIIFLTAKNQTADILNGFESGGNDYLKKPFSMEELIVRVNNLLSLTQAQNTNSKEEINLKLSDRISFFPQQLQLKIDENLLSLSHKESQLLDILVNSKNETVERKQILLKIWGDDSYFNSRTLDVYIRKLRKHLAADEQIKIITLKGIGYRFYVG